MERYELKNGMKTRISRIVGYFLRWYKSTITRRKLGQVFCNAERILVQVFYNAEEKLRLVFDIVEKELG